MSPLITLNAVTKIYRTKYVETHALRGVDLTVERGEYVAIAGVSGSGKSTLLYVLGLLASPSDGDYHLDGDNVSRLSVDERARIRNAKVGFVFQNYNLIDELTVWENVCLPFRYRDDGKDIPRDQVAQSLVRLGLDHRRDHFPRQLSGGQQQRVAIARALVTNPHLLLLDEPTGSLDTKTRDELLELLDEIRAAAPQMAILNVTHDGACAARAQRVLNIRDGRVQ